VRSTLGPDSRTRSSSRRRVRYAPREILAAKDKKLMTQLCEAEIVLAISPTSTC
jgi:hypothetical protein